MWAVSPEDDFKVLFVGNQPGSNNNRGRTTGAFLDATDAEYTARNAANLAWLNKAFDRMQADPNIKGVVIAYQSNPFERYQSKQVLLVNGNTHYFRTDRPLTSTCPED